MHHPFARTVSLLAGILALTVAARAEDKPAPDMKAMMEMMEKMGSPNENHKLLDYFVGAWDYRMKMWMDPSAPPQESSGSVECKSVWGGRYFHTDHTGKMEMPGPDGKPVAREFIGAALNGYNNMKQRFFAAWIDNMSTGLTVLEGAYDATKKVFTYSGEMDCPMTPNVPMKVREVITITGPDQYLFEWHEQRDGKERRTMEITYTRRK